MSRTQVSRSVPDAALAGSPRADGVMALTGVGVFAALVVALHFMDTELEPCCRWVSEYSLGDHGALMKLAFLALGCGFLALAHGLRRGLAPRRRVTASVRLMYAVGVTVILSGAFDSDSLPDTLTDRATWHGTLHDLAGFVGFLLLMLVSCLLRGVFARDAEWRRFAPHAVLFAVAMAVTFAVAIVAPLDSLGVAQRAFITVDVLWVGTLACALLGAAPASATADRPTPTTPMKEKHHE